MQRIHRGPVNSPHKWPVTRKMFPFDDVIMSFVNVVSLCQECMRDSSAFHLIRHLLAIACLHRLRTKSHCLQGFHCFDMRSISSNNTDHRSIWNVLLDMLHWTCGGGARCFLKVLWKYSAQCLYVHFRYFIIDINWSPTSCDSIPMKR